MKSIVLALSILVSFSAFGNDGALDASLVTCDQLKATVQNAGAISIKSIAGVARYVTDVSQCKSDETIDRGFVFGTYRAEFSLCEVGFVCIKNGEVVDSL